MCHCGLCVVCLVTFGCLFAVLFSDTLCLVVPSVFTTLFSDTCVRY